MHEYFGTISPSDIEHLNHLLSLSLSLSLSRSCSSSLPCCRNHKRSVPLYTLNSISILHRRPPSTSSCILDASTQQGSMVFLADRSPPKSMNRFCHSAIPQSELITIVGARREGLTSKSGRRVGMNGKSSDQLSFLAGSREC
jgi:hypothetical protein